MLTALLNDDIQNTQKKKYDAACKRLLGQKIILAQILKSCVKEFAEYSTKDIADIYIEGNPQIALIRVNPNETNKPLIQGSNTEDNSINEGKITYDILFYAIVPQTEDVIKIIINVEAQRNTSPGYPISKRAIYYCNRLISAQYGREFTNSEYDKIKKVYSIWICLDAPEYKQNTITSYEIKEKLIYGNNKEELENYDLLTATIINVSKDINKTNNNIIKLLSTLLSDTLSAEVIIKELNQKFNIPMTEKIETEVFNMCNLSQAIEDKGIQKGLQKGIQEGIENGKKETAFELYQDGFSIKQIAKYTKVSIKKPKNGLKNLPKHSKKSCI